MIKLKPEKVKLLDLDLQAREEPGDKCRQNWAVDCLPNMLTFQIES